MHSLQELHHETLKLSELLLFLQCYILRRKETKELSCSSFGLGHVSLVGFQETWYTFICVFSFAERSLIDARREEKSSTFSMEIILTELRAIITHCLRHQRKDFFHKSALFSEFIFFSGHNRLDWVSLLFVYCLLSHWTSFWLIFFQNSSSTRTCGLLSPFYSRNILNLVCFFVFCSRILPQNLCSIKLRQCVVVAACVLFHNVVLVWWSPGTFLHNQYLGNLVVFSYIALL